MRVRGSFGAIRPTREFASPPTSRAVGDPHLRKLSEVLDDDHMLRFHLGLTVHHIRAPVRVPERAIERPVVAALALHSAEMGG